LIAGVAQEKSVEAVAEALEVCDGHAGRAARLLKGLTAAADESLLG